MSRYMQGFIWEKRKKGHWEDLNVGGSNILKWMFKECYGGEDWTDVANNKNRSHALIDAVMKLWVPQSAGKYLTSSDYVSFLGSTFLH
jgi:hypothetical protein